MKVKWMPFWGRLRRGRDRPRSRYGRGVTLVEVLAGLVVLGTILAAVAVARGRFLRQTAVAEQRIAAAAALEPLLSEWLAAPVGSLRVPDEGELPGVEGMYWRRGWEGEDPKLGAVVMRVEVLARGRTAGAVLGVELLFRDPRLMAGGGK